MFFTHIHQIMTQGVDLTLVIHKTNNGMLTVSTLPKANGLKDGVQNYIVPLTLTGTPAELDGGFMPTICQPIQKTSGLLANLSEFEQAASKASAASKPSKEKKTVENKSESKEEKEKREKYEKYIKKADELIGQEKYSEGIINLQQAVLHCSEEEKITIYDRIADTKLKAAQGSLFDLNEIPVQPTQQLIQNQPLQPQPVQQQTPPPQFQQYYQQQQQRPQQQPPQYQQPYQHAQEIRYPDLPQMPQVQSGFDPNACRQDEYAQYVDFPAYGAGSNMYHSFNQ